MTCFKKYYTFICVIYYVRNPGAAVTDAVYTHERRLTSRSG